tara:strand:- start:15908 stop:16636 length:729 start_codon:yes stop_codon:yes gene_type:complete
MSIKIRIIKESKEKQDTAAVEAVAAALGISAEEVENAMGATEDDELSESIMSMLTDPMVIAGLVAVAAMGKAALNNAVSSIKRGTESNDQTMKRILGDDWRDKAKQAAEQKKARLARAKEERAQMKAALGMGDTEPLGGDITKSTPGSDGGGGSAEEAELNAEIEGLGLPKGMDIKKLITYTKLMNKIRSGEGKIDKQPAIQKFHKKWTPEVAEEESKKLTGNTHEYLNVWYSLNEAFKRFL